VTSVPPIEATPMSPGTYLRKRREAAGISIELAALAFVPWPGHLHYGRSLTDDLEGVRAWPRASLLNLVQHVATRLAEMEADERHEDGAITACIARFVPLDVEIYDRLVAVRHGVDVPLPQICRECGCSWHRPCVDRVESGIPGCFAEYGCSWSASDPNLCTACERKAAEPEQENVDAS
jgi:hypothetical protein